MVEALAVRPRQMAGLGMRRSTAQWPSSHSSSLHDDRQLRVCQEASLIERVATKQKMHHVRQAECLRANVQLRHHKS